MLLAASRCERGWRGTVTARILAAGSDVIGEASLLLCAMTERRRELVECCLYLIAQATLGY